MSFMLTRVPLAAALLFLTLVGPALASDGVLEINQTCATQTGCFAGDTPGFPVTIDGTAGRSCRLTSDLTIPNENTDGIVVSTSSISIDLGGFEILGPVTCSGTPLICTFASGSGSGVRRTSSTNRGISVKNGSITGMGQDGLNLGDQAEVVGLRTRWNRAIGIAVGVASTVSASSSFENKGIGIASDQGSSVSGNTVYRNGSIGINAQAASTVSGNIAYLNGAVGIQTSNGSTVSANTSYQNLVAGISAGSGSTVERNTSRTNGGFGLLLSADSSYRDNTVSNNTGGTISSGVNTGGNVCNGSLICP